MTKNILSISASDVDVERIFNTACDVCHYCQNHLNLDTIEMIMLVKWYEKLELTENSDSSNEEKTETDELPIDEQSVTVIQEKVEWKTESDESILNINEY